jgi:hypothetical protein
MSLSNAKPLALSDPKVTALCIALGARVLHIEESPNGRLQFLLEGVPSDIHERLLNDTLTVSAKKFIDAMEGVLGIISQRQRARRA